MGWGGGAVYTQAVAINNYFRAAGKMAGPAQLSKPTQSSLSPHITSVSLVILHVLKPLPEIYLYNSKYIKLFWEFFHLLFYTICADFSTLQVDLSSLAFD